MFLSCLKRFFETRGQDPRNHLAHALITAEEAEDKLSSDEFLAKVLSEGENLASRLLTYPPIDKTRCQDINLFFGWFSTGLGKYSSQLSPYADHVSHVQGQ